MKMAKSFDAQRHLPASMSKCHREHLPLRKRAQRLTEKQMQMPGQQKF
jgi:hypothetical protein